MERKRKRRQKVKDLEMQRVGGRETGKENEERERKKERKTQRVGGCK